MSKTKFKQTEIGKIPEDWEVFSLGDIADSVSNTFKFGDEKVVFLNTGDVLDGKVLHSEKTDPSILPGQAKKKIMKNDILFSEIRPVNKRFVFIDFDCSNYVVSTKLMVIRYKEKVLPKYLYLLLTNYNTLNVFQKLAESRSGTFPQITFESISTHLFALPKKEEQEIIANFIFIFDKKIEFNQRMNKTLGVIGQAIFKQWFVDFEFPNEEGKPYKSSGGEMIDSELGDIPKGWRVGRFKDIASDKKNAIVDGPFGTQLHSAEYKSEGISVIRIINLSFDGRFIDSDLVFIDEEKFNELKRSATYPGDILLAKTGATIGKYSILPFYIDKAIVASSVLKITPKNNRYYLYNIIKNLSKQDYWARISSGSTRSTINLDDVKKIEIIIPPQKIIGKYELLMEKFYSLIETSEIQNLTLSKIRDALLLKLMTGEIRVPLEVK